MKKILSLLLGACTMFTACTDTETIDVPGGSKLSLSVQTAAIESRGLIESTTLPDGHFIGLTLVDAGGTTYDTQTYQNIQFTASTGKTPQEWTPSSDILLSATNGTLFGYYPFNPDVTDITQIPVSSGETDYMYATPVEGINETNHEAVVTMNHALAAIRLNIVRGTYFGTGDISSVSVKGDGIANTGMLNAINGELTSPDGAGTAIVNENGFTLSTTAQPKDFIFIPVSGTSAVPEFFVTVDGKEYEASGAAITFERGIVYEYTLTVNSKEMTLSDVTIGDWGYNQSGNPVIDCGYKITLAGDIYNFAFSNTVYPNGRVDIVVVSLEDDGKYIDDISCSEGCTFTKSLDDKGRLNIVLSEISNDITITFNGKSEYIDFDIAPNGVYAVAQNGKGLAVENADENCIAVALIVNDAAVPQRIMIEKTQKYHETLTSFDWNKGDINSLTNYSAPVGHLPMPDGTYVNTPNISVNYIAWTGCLSDFDGKNNTLQISGNGENTIEKILSSYNEQSNTNNLGFSDWYIPALGQLALIYLNMTEINAALTNIGGTALAAEDYWSSSEGTNAGNGYWKGWYVGFDDGYVGQIVKYTSKKYRFIRDIN